MENNEQIKLGNVNVQSQDCTLIRFNQENIVYLSAGDELNYSFITNAPNAHINRNSGSYSLTITSSDVPVCVEIYCENHRIINKVNQYYINIISLLDFDKEHKIRIYSTDTSVDTAITTKIMHSSYIRSENSLINDCFESNDNSNKYFVDSIYTMNIPEPFLKFVEDGAIETNDIEFTEDGLYTITKPLSHILIKYDISQLAKDENELKSCEVNLYYDDWHLYAVRSNSQYTYSLYKLREQEYNGEDGDDPGVTIPFIDLDISYLLNCLNSPTTENSFALYNKIGRVVGPEIVEGSENVVLACYFGDVNSTGAYMIAEQFIRKIANTNQNGNINPPAKYVELCNSIDSLNEDINNPLIDQITRLSLIDYRTKLRRIPDFLVENNEKAGYNIFNTTTYQLTINNPRSLTMYEKYAILAMFAANVNFNSFAAEVEFHADALYDWKSGIKDWVLIGIFPSADKWYNAAIRADMAIGEDSESGFYDQYYDLESDLVKNQAEVHGEF